MQKMLDDEWIKLESNHITPWAFFNSHVGPLCKDFHGSDIVSGGIEFSGSIRDRFWHRYIEPFLEEITCRSFKEARLLAAEREQDLKPVLAEMAGLLVTLTRKSFIRMSDIDRRLRGRGYPQSVPRYNTDRERGAMEAFIQRHLQAEMAMVKPAARNQSWWRRFDVAVLLGLIIALLSLGATLGSWLFPVK